MQAILSGSRSVSIEEPSVTSRSVGGLHSGLEDFDRPDVRYEVEDILEDDRNGDEQDDETENGSDD
jgi:hypothetical protein